MGKYLKFAFVFVFVAFLAIPSAQASTGFSRISHADGYFVSGSSTTVNFTNLPPVGSAYVLTVGTNTTTQHVNTVTGGGVTWVKAVSSNVQRDAEIWYGVNSDGSNKSITINTNATNGTVVWNITLWDGIATTSPLESTGSSSGVSSTLSTGTLTTTNPVDLVIAMERNSTSPNFVSGPTNGFSDLIAGQPTIFNAAYKTASSTGAYNTSWTQGASVPYETVMAAFRHQ